MRRSLWCFRIAQRILRQIFCSLGYSVIHERLNCVRSRIYSPIPLCVTLSYQRDTILPEINDQHVTTDVLSYFPRIRQYSAQGNVFSEFRKFLEICSFYHPLHFIDRMISILKSLFSWIWYCRFIGLDALHLQWYLPLVSYFTRNFWHFWICDTSLMCQSEIRTIHQYL